MKILRQLGPGIVIAATGLGAGDLIAASVAGAEFGYALLWAAVLGAVLKFALNEGLARWQLVTGTTLLEGWKEHLPAWISWYFIAYLLLWTFVVAGALMSACGLALHALFPAVSVEAGGALQSLLAAALVLFGRYQWLETIMKFFIGMMFLVIVYSAWVVFPGWSSVLQGVFRPSVPDGSLWFLLGIVGGVGGSVTMLSYGYWMREHGWTDRRHQSIMRIDVAVAYTLTALFAIAVMLVSAGVGPGVMTGSGMVLSVGEQLGKVAGDTGELLFLIGFWGAVFSSMLGVWQGVPYLFCDFVTPSESGAINKVDTRCLSYRLYLAGMSILPMSLLAFGKPVWLVILYAVVGALFMPLLAALLLYMNNRNRWLGEARNGWLSNLAIAAALMLFATLFVHKLLDSV